MTAITATSKISPLAGHTPDAACLSDLWTDRRVAQRAYKGRDQRRGIDRRMRQARIAHDLRSRRVARQHWRSGRLERLLLAAGDGLALLAAFALGMLVSNAIFGPPAAQPHAPPAGLPGLPFQIETLTILAVVLAFWIRGHYAARRPFWDELPDTFKILAAGVCGQIGLAYFAHWPLPRACLATSWAFAFVLVPWLRTLTRVQMIRMGGWMRPTVIIGTGQAAADTARALLSEPLLGYQVMCFLEPAGVQRTAGQRAVSLTVNGRRLPVYCLPERPAEQLIRLGRPNVVVALDSYDDDALLTDLQKSRDAFASLNIMPGIRGLPLIGTRIMHFFRHEVMLLQVTNNLARRMPQRIKRIFDLVVATVLLILLAPLFAWCGMKPFFSHTRVGQKGKSFPCHKFQTMVPNADEVLAEILRTDPDARAEWKENLKLRDDPRVTKLGAFLRRTSLDELPQLWNVVKGEMSLVGPRPIVTAEIERYGDYSSYYLECKPGLTGLWQISGRSDVTYEERVALDVWYARNWTLWYDIVILLKTFGEVMIRRGAY